MKKMSLSIAAVLSIAGATAAFAAELPSYETTGFPVSPVQVGVLGAANVREQSPVATSTVTPLQLSVLTPRSKITTAGRIEPDRSRDPLTGTSILPWIAKSLRHRRGLFVLMNGFPTSIVARKVG